MVNILPAALHSATAQMSPQPAADPHVVEGSAHRHVVALNSEMIDHLGMISDTGKAMQLHRCHVSSVPKARGGRWHPSTVRAVVASLALGAEAVPA